MRNLITSLASLATASIVLAGCGNGGTVHLTPPPTVTGYVQIERLARPAIKEVFEPFQDHQKTNAAEPYADTTMANDIVLTENALRPPNAALGTNYGTTLKSVLYPDEYTVNLAGATPAGADPYYFLSEVADPGAFGGRAPNDDVIYLELNALFGPLLSELKAAPDDNEEDRCLMSQNIAGVGVPGGQNSGKLSSSKFPYLPTPH